MQGRVHPCVCMCVHMLGCGAQVCSTPVQSRYVHLVHTLRETQVCQKRPASFLSLNRLQSCAEPASSCLAGSWISAGVPSREEKVSRPL